MSKKGRISVLLAEDHNEIRQGIRKLLEAECDIEVVGEAKNGRQAVGLAKKLRPAIAVLDITMPVLNGLEAARQIRKLVPDSKVLILSAHSDETYVEKAIELGAKGYLTKHNCTAVIAKAIREVQKGKTHFTPSIAKKFRKKNTPDKQH